MTLTDLRLALLRIGTLIAAVGLPIAICGCATPSAESIAHDVTPAAWIDIEVVYQRASDGARMGTEVIPSSGFVKRNLSRENRLVLSTLVGDAESGVARIRLVSPEEKWDCVSGDLGQHNVATLDGLSDEERGGSGADGLPILRQAHFTIDPFNGNTKRLVCPSGQDSTKLTVTFRIEATNGKGLRTTTGQIEFVYVPRAATLPLAPTAFCGDSERGQIFQCPQDGRCQPLQETICSGWWIFKTCDRIQSTELFCRPAN